MKHSFRRACLLVCVLGFLIGQAAPPPELAPEEAPPPEAPTEDVAPETSPATTAGEADTPSSTEEAAPAPAEENGDPTAPAPPAAAGKAATTNPRPKLSSLPTGANVAVIPIEGVIYDFTTESLKRRVEKALNQGASVIVLEIDTYGGLVTSALDIAKYLKDPAQVPVPTIAWVNPNAYSAGILISAACDEIVMAPASATGDCAPIAPGQNLAPTERAKAFSPIAREFEDSATKNGYTYATFHAMCELGIELYLIENPATGQRKVVNQADYAVMVKGDDSARAGIKISRQESGGSSSSPLPLPLPGGNNNADGTTTVLGIAESLEAGVNDLGNWVPVTTLPSGKTAPNGRIHAGVNLLFTPGDVLAADIDLSKATVANDADLQRYLGAASVTRIDPTWSENFAAFLSGWWVRVVLIILLALGVFLELQAPGLGIPAAIAVLALFGLFGAPMIIGLADVWHILLFAVGLILLVVEVTMTPTFGVLGIVGIIVMLAALVLAVVPTGGGNLPAPEMWDALFMGMLTTLIGFVGACIGVGVLINYFGKVPGLNRLILANDGPALEGVDPATGRESRLAGSAALGDGKIAVGQTGTVVSTLRPAGEANFDDQTVDVVSVGPYIERGQAVRVVEVQKFTIVVEAVEES